MEKKIITRFQGGFGNQFFIYCASLALDKYCDIDLLIDNSSGYHNDPYKRQFQADFFVYDRKIILSRKTSLLFFYLMKVLRKLGAANNFLIKRITEENFKEILQGKTSLGLFNYLDGYFQFWDVPEVNQEFLYEKFINYFQSYLLGLSLDAQDNFHALAAGEFIICHVRRQNYERLDMSFYLEALKEKSTDNIPVCFISDDIEWVKREIGKFTMEREVRFAEMRDPLQELYLLVKASSAIISISTFSWLGAWLSCIRRNSFTEIYYPSYNSTVIVSDGFLHPEWKGIVYSQEIENTTI